MSLAHLSPVYVPAAATEHKDQARFLLQPECSGLAGNTPTQTALSSVKQLFLCISSLDDIRSLLQKIVEVEIQQQSRVLHRYNGAQLSMYHVLSNQKILNNKASSQYHIPLLVGGTLPVSLGGPIQVTITYAPKLDLQLEQSQLYCVYGAPGPHDHEPLREYVTLEHWRVGQLPRDDDTWQWDITELQNAGSIAALVAYIPGKTFLAANSRVLGYQGDSKTTSTNPTTILAHPNNYNNVVLDKFMYGHPLPKQPILTWTFSDWLEQDARSGLVGYDRLVLEIGLDNQPLVDQPNEDGTTTKAQAQPAEIQYFAIVIRPALQSVSSS